MRGHCIAAGIVAVACSCTAAACDPGQPARPRPELVIAAPARDFVSGARLRARYHVVDGLVTVFSTFHDAELDVDCAYEDESGAHVGPNASSYCLPSGMARHREGTGPYVDATCTTRAAFPAAGSGSAGGAAAAYALVEPRDACATAPEIHAVQAPVRRRVFLRDEAGACVVAAADIVQPFAGVLPLATFVRAVEHVEPREGRIAARVLVGDDGSRRVVGGFDRARAEASRAGLAADGTRRWLPARTAFVGGGELLFADGACATPVAAKIARTAICPLDAALVLDGSCGAGRYFELGAPMTDVFARDAASACVARQASGQLVFGLGAAIPTSAFATVSSVDVGGSRIRRRGLGGAGDLPAVWGEVIDGESGEPCDVATLGDGSLRCLPSASAAVGLFADEACSEPGFARAITGCEVGPGARFVRDAFDEPPRVFEVGRELAAVYTTEAGRCVRFAPTVPSRLFAASEVYPSRFPSAVLASD